MNLKEDDWWKASLKKIEMLYPYRHRFETYTENNKATFDLILETLSSQKESQKIKDKTAVLHEPA